MIAKKRLLPILVAVLMVFAMMPMSAGTVFAIDADTTPPEIDVSSLQVTLPEGKTEVTVGDSVEISVKASYASGVRSVDIYYNYPGSTGQHRLSTTYNPDTEAYEATFQITEDVSSGVCKISFIVAYDSKDNNVQLYNSDVTETLYPDLPAAFFQPQADLTAGDFTVSKRCMITFNTRGGSSIDPQIVVSGQKAAEPEKPIKEGREFRAWYSDEELTKPWFFEKSVTEDITLYAGWIINAGIGVFNQSNPDNHQCGTIDIASDSYEYNHRDITTMNYTLPEEPVTFTAKPAEGYIFKGWYEGVFGESHFIETPSENLVSNQNPYTPENVDEAKALCAVFDICPGHTWEQKIQKATPTSDGRIYQECSLCGTEETLAPLLKVSNIKLAGTSYTYTGKAIKPKVTVANASEALAADQFTVAY